MDKSFKGMEAKEKMLEILASNAACCALAERVGQFFGSALLLTLGEYQEESSFALFLWPHVDQVHIKLGLKSYRTREALTHELLHGNLLVEGFPWFDTSVDRSYGSLFNYVHHALMYPAYVDCGLDPAKFFVPGAHNRAYLNNPKADFAFWCREWCANWQAWRLLRDLRCKEWAEELLVLLEKKYPTLQATTLEIEAWFDAVEYRDPSNFEHAYNQLASLMGMPVLETEHWFRLLASQPSPILSRTLDR